MNKRCLSVNSVIALLMSALFFADANTAANFKLPDWKLILPIYKVNKGSVDEFEFQFNVKATLVYNDGKSDAVPSENYAKADNYFALTDLFYKFKITTLSYT